MNSPTTIREAPTDTRSWWARESRHYLISAGVGTLLALSGAFDTLDVPLHVRLAYWVPLMLIGSTIGSLVTENMLKVERWTGSPWLSWLAVTLSVGLIMAPIVWGIGIGLGWASPDIRLAAFYLAPSLAISGLMAGIGVLFNQVPAVTHAAQSDPSQPEQAAPARPAFLDRLPARLYGADLIAVEAQDHYLKVHTTRGSEMVLMRLADAVKELEGIEGARVHRSWWVARGAVVEAERGNGRAELTVTGGLEVPVSRSYARALREDGWFAAPR